MGAAIVVYCQPEKIRGRKRKGLMADDFPFDYTRFFPILQDPNLKINAENFIKV